MKRILWFVLSLSFWQLNAQDFDGVYFGEIFSMKNTFVLSTTGNTAIGSIYLNQNDKIIFLGSVEQSRLTGTIQANKTLWEVVGELKGDSLFLSMTTVTDRRFLRLKKISKNPKFNINKLMTGKSSLDIGLIGEWLLLKTYNADGTEKPIKDTKDMRYRINSDGSLVMDSPYISRFISLNHGSFPTFKWETSGAKFIQTGGSIGRGQSVVIESTYHVSSDTLILEYRGSKDVMVRIKKKIKK